MVIGRPPSFLSQGAGASQLRVVRREIGAWLDGMAWPPEDRDALVTAVDEAGTLVIAGAHRLGIAEEFAVAASVHSNPEARYLVVTVQGCGGIGRNMPDDGIDRTLAVRLLKSLVSRLRIGRGPYGLVIRLASHAVPMN